MNFVPDKDKTIEIPFFEDARKEDGWQGHTTTKAESTLQDEITKSISRLGGVVSGFQKGSFQHDNKTRMGYQIHYALNSPRGFVPARLDIAALPVRDKWNNKKKDQSLRMALYMLREALDGMWLMQQLIPGYAALMPFMIAQDNKTVSQLWAENSAMKNLLPAGEEFVEGVVENA